MTLKREILGVVPNLSTIPIPMQQTKDTSVLTGTRAQHHPLYRVTSFGEQHFGGPLPQTLAM